MTTTARSVANHFQQRLRLFLALSRTPHGLIDMTAPALAALLCLGHFPKPSVVLVGLLTVFAGYTAVYALNDLVDFLPDRKKVKYGGYNNTEKYLDGVWIRHPLAKGALSLWAGMAWTLCWTLVTLIGAYWLNPVCLYLFLAGCLLETLYCTLWRVTPLRTLINGIVKTIGALAAVFAVNSSPSIPFLAVLFLWLFFWEIGGQNIPNDWTDMEEDTHFGAQTIPVKLGAHRASLISMAALVLTLFLNLLMLWLSPLSFNAFYLVATVLITFFMLLQPALRLAENQARRHAMELFNKASYYPLATFVLVLVRIVQP